MQQEKNKFSVKQIIIGIIILAVLIAGALYAYKTFSPKPVEGSKSITVAVIDDKGERTTYTHKTDAEFLRTALEEIKDLKIEGEESDYGLYVKTINGVTADYNVNGAFWSFSVNGESCNNGIDTQPVYDNDSFEISYEAQ
ncbi:DUF4430 domain-containing protein [Anaerosporobacter sp.]|uniref:DUF4430 domain-containing protein n=1 Tax=Anaerosporobacter sp. TaxID=1872529 RepID=UPI00286F70AA|nr:DUF4430 domain-containing protein [Anaerosporobacter sp.]